MTDTSQVEPSGDGEPGAATQGQKLSMGIDPYERNWMRLSAALLVVFFATVSVAGFAMGFQLNGAETEVDPRTVLDSDPWASPGLRQISDDHFQAYVVAKTWAFEPRVLEVPVGATIDIYVTSPDLQHGFKITDTNVNMMVVPGQVSKVTYTFDQVGEFPYLCHEYCGRGHAAMFGVVSVISEADFQAQQDLGQDDQVQAEESIEEQIEEDQS
jgi:cytochrome c oxidase subunit 2